MWYNIYMRKIIEKLHQKPERYRKNVALGISFVITLMIFGIWVTTLPGRFNDIGAFANKAQENIEEGITPLATVKSSFDTAIKSVGDIKKSVGIGSDE